MSVIPRALGQTVVTTKEEFEQSGAHRGSALLIQNFDEDQLLAGSPNLSYDLRIGAVYKDHRDGGRRDLADDSCIILLPGGAIVIETEEDLPMPRGMFGYIVPRVKWLHEGVSNTLSKVDPGYSGHLLVTLFNLGRKPPKFHVRNVSVHWSFIESAPILMILMFTFTTKMRKGSPGHSTRLLGGRRPGTSSRRTRQLRP